MALFNSKHGVDDMVMLSSIDNDAITDNLKKRYTADMIYTYIGHVLIAMNPYKVINGIYSDQTLRDYRGKYRYELAPHVFALSDHMYRAMLSEGDAQCVIISGESGAGKTWTAKKIMHYIAAVSGAQEEVTRVKDVILGSNPLLEAFGNAATIRNNNSSRFGKYMEIQFDLKGDPEGGLITNYLLEKSRVVYQQQGERNFHIFYQLLVGSPQNLQQEFGLAGPECFHYTNQSSTYTVPGIDDRKEFAEMHEAMQTIGFSQQEIHDIFKLVAAILYIGNITFVPNAKGESQISDKQAVETAAYLLETEPIAVEQSILYRTITTGQGGRGRSSVYSCPQNVDECNYARDALAKAFYSRMFDYIVQRVNDAMFIDDPDALIIGILDIYGFEIFGKNGFEQMCINFVNERLQQIFIQLTLKAEQEEYANEGIPWQDIKYFNNKICCDLIESKRPPGIMMILDDVCNFPKATDLKFLGKCVKEFEGHAHFAQGGPDEFIVKHYAGDVHYNVDGFCDKNKDLLWKDLYSIADCTSNQWMSSLFPEAKELLASKKKPTTAGFKIKNSIQDLVNALSRCEPHYIRCIKPNEKKAPNNFDVQLVKHQVKYLGLLENVKIRRAGYAYRHPYEKFFYRYRVICPQTWPNWSGDFVSGTEAILNHLGMSLGKEYSKGKTKIFVKQPESVFAIEEMRDRTVFEYANRIQRFLQKTSLRKFFYELKKSANDPLSNKKERRRQSLDRTFKLDYIKYRQNHKLKACIGDRGDKKILFADNCNKFDKKFLGSKMSRRILIVTPDSMYLVGIMPNKDKEERAVKPFLYMLTRTIPLNRISGITLSPHADNFIYIGVNGVHGNLLECRRKTELVGVLSMNARVSVTFSPTIPVMLKGKSKPCNVKFVVDPRAPGGRIKGTKVSIAPGLPASSSPNITPPPSDDNVGNFTIQEVSYKDQILAERKANPMAKARGAGGAQQNRNITTARGRGGGGVGTRARSGVRGPGGPSRTPSRGPPRGGGIMPMPRGGSAVGMGVPIRARGGPRGGGGRARGGPRGGGRARGAPRGSAPRGGGGPPRGGGPPPGGAARGKPQVRALYDFVAENDDELNFNRGDVVDLIRKANEDWWEGELNGRVGVFPANYVEEITGGSGGGGRGRGRRGRRGHM